MPQITEQIRQDNEKFLSAAKNKDTAMQKVAEDAATDYTREKMREEGILRRLMELETLTNNDLDKQINDSGWVKIYELEPQSPAAVSTALATFTEAVWLRGRRYPIQLQRYQTNRFQCDVDMLRTWDMDLRQIVSDNSIKDTLAFEDGKLFALIERALVGPDQNTTWSGIPQWVTLAGGMDRDTCVEATKIMGRTDASLEPKNGIINATSFRDFMKWGRDEFGGDGAEDIIKNGFKLTRFLDIDWIVTIKHNLVQDDRWYMFGDQSFLGHFVSLADMTMFVKTESWMMEFFSYEIMGLGFGHTAALAIADFTAA